MSEKLITAAHVMKLGHGLQEIRERALSNIISKLDNGFTYDNDLARSKEILTKLFEWFLYEPCTHQEVVFSLIKRILRSNSGNLLLGHYGAIPFKNEINQIRRYIEPQFHKDLDEVITIIDEIRINKVLVPPLESDLPLSYRTGESNFVSNRDEDVGTTATIIEGFVHQESSVNEQDCIEINEENRESFIIEPLQWQNLIEPDRHVLHTVQNNIKNSTDSGGVLHSAEFFSNVLLNDFPAEIFLQRPTIVKCFFTNLNDSSSFRLSVAILTALDDLTRALLIRVQQYKDPCMYNCKNYVTEGLRNESTHSTPDSNVRRSLSGQSNDDYEDLVSLKRDRMSLNRFATECLKIVLESLCPKIEKFSTRRKLGMNKALELLEDIVKLLSMILSNNIWKEKTNQIFLEIFKHLTDVLVTYGDTLEYFRIEALSDYSNVYVRIFQLCLLKNCLHFLNALVPLSHCAIVLPKNLKNTLVNCLVDVILAKLYPETHATLLRVVESFSIGRESESLKKYKKVDGICQSMTAFTQFINACDLGLRDFIRLAKNSLICFEFHKNVKFLTKFINICASKLPLDPENEELLADVEYVTLRLLAYDVSELREEMYKLCRKKVATCIGPKLNLSGSGAPGAQILFLIRTEIFIEITSHGLTSDNPEIQRCAEDILIHILKSKILVPDDIWDRIVQALITSLPIILCFAGKNSSLERTCLNLVDPDSAKDLYIPEIEVIRGNVAVLFSNDLQAREEAFSRLCWLISSQQNSKDLLPRLNNLYDKALPNVCRLSHPIDMNKNRTGPHFYQPSSLQHVIDLLKSPNVEPVIRRSALTQIGVMTEDPLLHVTFLENSGIQLLTAIMESALIERDFRDYPDSIIPTVAILKNVCLYNPIARQELALNINVLFCVLRGLFMFFAEDKMRQDGTILLFLLTYRDFISGSPSLGDLTVSEIVLKKMKTPIICKGRWKESPYTLESSLELISADPWAMSSIQIQWTTEMCGGIENLITNEKIDLNSVPDNLKLKDHDLELLKAASIRFYLLKYLMEIQNSTSHSHLIETTQKLTTYILFCRIYGFDGDILELPWKMTFLRFLKDLPSCEFDEKLLMAVFKFLHVLVPLYRNKADSWLTDAMKKSSNFVHGLLQIKDPDDEDDCKLLAQNFFKLMKSVIIHDEILLNRLPPPAKSMNNPPDVLNTWCDVLHMMAFQLKFDKSLQFYNLSYLESILSCLVQITATMGWSKQVTKSYVRKFVETLTDLAIVFHRGKGAITTVSVMGLSVTRNVVLSLNHIISEMITFRVKGWENSFLELVLVKRHWVLSYFVHVTSRDVVLRAATYQLLAAMSTCPRLAVEIVTETLTDGRDIWHIAMETLLDDDEAPIVKEGCANFLSALASQSMVGTDRQINLIPGLVPNSKDPKDDLTYVLKLLDDCVFYKNVVRTLYNLYTNKMIGTDALKKMTEYSTRTSTSSSGASTGSSINFGMTTPTLVKNLAQLVENFHELAPQQLSNALQQHGLTKLFFRCLCNPTMATDDVKKMSLYCEILEMDDGVCSLLRQLVKSNENCLGTVLHTRDCLTALISLLNPRSYDISYPHLLYLRNILWKDVYALIIALATSTKNCNQRQTAVNLLSQAINESGSQSFIDTICESIHPTSIDDLRGLALAALTSLIEIEIDFCITDSSFKSKSTLINCHREGDGDFEGTPSYLNFLEDVYYSKKLDAGGGDNGGLACTTAGVEICRLLLDLYNLCTLRADQSITKQKSLIVSCLSSTLGVSRSARHFALDLGLLQILLKRLGDFNLELGVESVDLLRRVSDRKRLNPILFELDELVGLATNFMANDLEIKINFAENGLSDLVHKLWPWFATSRTFQLDVLRMLATFTNGCPIVTACQSMALTSAIAGSGLRRVPGKVSLLNVLVALIEKEMEHVSKTHDLTVLTLSMEIVSNCCCAADCRNLLVKSTLLQGVRRLHPVITKRQFPWEMVEKLWLDFLQIFSLHPEGQSSIAKVNDVFELLMTLATNPKPTNKLAALLVLRNVSFYQPNRAKLLNSSEFIHILRSKLDSGNEDERSAVVIIMWTLAANNQKAKIVFKASQLDLRLQQILKQYEIKTDLVRNDIIVDRVRYVLGIIRDKDN